MGGQGSLPLKWQTALRCSLRGLLAGFFNIVKRSNSRGKAKEKEQKVHRKAAPFAEDGKNRHKKS